MRKFWVAAAGAAIIAAGAATSIAVAATPPASTSTFGPIPDSAYTQDGGLDVSQVPDFVTALDRSGDIADYVKRSDLMAPPNAAGEGQTVYAADGSTIVGRMTPGLGFVPAGTDPNSVRPYQVIVGSAVPTK